MLKNNKLKVKTVWGKNPELEKFWKGLSSGKHVVLLYKTNKNTSDKPYKDMGDIFYKDIKGIFYKDIKLPPNTTKKYKLMFNAFEEDPNIIAVLSSNMSQDAYELFLYPKAKNNTVESVIRNYKKLWIIIMFLREFIKIMKYYYDIKRVGDTSM
jgi:hypothetical protein